MSDENLPKEEEKDQAPQEQETSANEVEKASEEVTQENSEEANTKDAPEKEEAVTAEDQTSEKAENTSQKDSEEETEDDEEEVSSSDDEEHDEETEEEEVDYHSLSKKELITEFQKLLKDKPVQNIKNAVEEIRTEFNAQFADEMEQKKEEFLADGGNIIDFHYTTPLKKEFHSLYFDYKEKRNNYYKNLKRDLQANLDKRMELIEELKGLLTIEENINTTYKHFKDIQDKWHTAGPIPRDKYNLVWNTYHHHVENFYDFLHLNREFRDLDFKHNLEQKLKIIGRAEELAQEENLNKAFRELQMLHKMWKEDIGPVAKEYREEVWEKFSEATKTIHEKRQAFIAEQEKDFEKNYEAKLDLVSQINEITENTKDNHKAWQNAIKKVQELRDQYFEAGKVPRNKNKEIWNAFKEATRTFNRTKNSFYKNQKKKQYENLEKKKELVKIAEENKDSDDFNVVTPLMKKIQSDWKSIGHVPRKDSDKIWKQFKEACNYYFDRLHAQKDEANKEELEHYKAKEALLEEVSNLELSGDTDKDLQLIKEKIAEWKAIGRVPYSKKKIDQKFNKVLDGLFGKLKMSKKEAEMIRYENKLDAIVSQEDDRKLRNEKFFISKKVTEIKAEIRQLENNLGFFQHADDDNPLVKEVHKNIQKQKDALEVWKAKLKKLKAL
ncbi:MAG: chromosome segregation protein [Flavobacteriaceae bacterium]|nr:chromosome segregation protein [Flavobacteriaceae bacterium]|tara:strand:- start:63581 stop:65581 length:2001 start_codon:yes stop_codon:yes gene_type:complete